MDPVLCARFLGVVEVMVDGVPLRGLESRKALALLGYLSVRREAISRTFLASLFWPEASEAKGRENLRWVLARLAKYLPDCLEISHASVALRPRSALWLDTQRFLELSTQGEAGALAEAVELLRGEFMAGFYLNGCPEFETWLLHEREVWRQHFAYAFQTLIGYERGRGNYRAALAYATRLLALDPFDEEAQRSRLLLLALSGQRSAALAHFQAYQQLLWQELGVEPEERTFKLYEQVQAGELAFAQAQPPQPGPGWPAYLAPQTPLLGRGQELAWLAQASSDPGCRLITILGPGGIGKTRLALHFAELQHARFRDGVAVVSLAAVASYEGLLFALAQALQVASDDSSPLLAQLLGALQGQQRLLLLDNFEQLCEHAPLLLELLQGAPRIKLLVTSRERLSLAPEVIFELGGLEVPDASSGTEAQRFPSVQLFLETARRSAPAFTFAESELQALVRICQLVQGMPLAIELAAPWVRVVDCAEILSGIERDLDFLSTRRRDLPARHRSLRAAFDYSWQRLAPEERAGFCKLAIFHGGFERAAARQVAGVTLPLLGALLDKSLLQRQAKGRYALHELLRQYALDQLQTLGEAAEAARRAHALYYLERVELITPQLHNLQQLEALDLIRQDEANLLAALAWARQQGEARMLLRLCYALWRFWLLKGDYREGRSWLESALSLAELQPQPDAELRCAIAQCQQALGDLLGAIGLYNQALVQLNAAYASFELQGDNGGLAISSGIIGRFKKRLGAFELAKTYFERQQRFAIEVNNRSEIAQALLELGYLAFERGAYSDALDQQQRSLQLFSELGNSFMMARLTITLANTYDFMGDYCKAFQLYERAFELAEQHGFRGVGCVAIGNTGELYLRYGLYPQALRCCQYSLQQAMELGAHVLISWQLGLLAELAGLQRHRAADRLYQQALELEHKLKVPDNLCSIYYHYAEHLLATGRLAEARANAHAAWTIANQYQLRVPLSQCVVHALLLKLELAMGELAGAEALGAIETLRAGAASAEDQAAISYLLWRIDPGQEARRQEAAQHYAALYARRPYREYRQRYVELTGEQGLPQPLPPDLSARISVQLRPFDELLHYSSATAGF